MNKVEFSAWADKILNDAGIRTKSEKARVAKVNAAIARIEREPDEIAALFRDTVERSVAQIQDADLRIKAIWEMDRKDREALNNEATACHDRGDKEQARKLWDKSNSMSKLEYIVTCGYETYGWRAKREDVVQAVGEETVQRWEELGDLYKLVGGRQTAGKEGYAKALAKSIVNVAGFADDIALKLGGDPEGCETDPHWGVGGYFNAILIREDRRVSFKSFFAGGWNIQRLHIRVKVSLLKQ